MDDYKIVLKDKNYHIIYNNIDITLDKLISKKFKKVIPIT